MTTTIEPTAHCAGLWAILGPERAVRFPRRLFKYLREPRRVHKFGK